MSNLKLALLIFTLSICYVSVAQVDSTSKNLKDSLVRQINSFLKTIPDTLKNKLQNKPSALKAGINDRFQKFKDVKIDSLGKSFLPTFSFKPNLKKRSLIIFNGGFISYNFNYRTNIDTPLVEKNIYQHSSLGNLNFSFAGIPLRMNYLLRRSNSIYYRDINDVQVEFNAAVFRNTLQNNLRTALAGLEKKLYDSLLEIDYKLKLKDFLEKESQLNDPFAKQKFLESKEILNLPDSANGEDSAKKTEFDLLKKNARIFIDNYEKQKRVLDSVRIKKEAVEMAYKKMKDNITKYKDFTRKGLSSYINSKTLQDSLARYGSAKIKIPATYSFLMNVRKFGLGRNQVNYSELTSKNISLKGINFEYNSWYYLAASAGIVDYTFRDFIVGHSGKSPQYMYMIRAGIGRLEKNYFILSAYKGRKQLFASGIGNPGLSTISLTGFAAEGKVQLTKRTYLVTEVAQSLSPDFRKNPSPIQKFSFSDKSNKALSIKFASFLPQTNSRLEASYKYTGANFQSFSSFQTNSSTKAWAIKYDQQLLRKRLKLSAALRTNDFENPYILQTYKANTTFKSLQATYHAKRFPTISIGYSPISQLTYVNTILTENRFYSFNTSVTHFYKFFLARATSTFTYNRFYNNEADTSFAYYNAKNYFFNQSFDFTKMLMSVSVSFTSSPGYTLGVINAFTSFKFSNVARIGFGLKANNFDNKVLKPGPYGNIQLNIKKIGLLTASFDMGYLPANNHQFLRNDMMNVGFIKQIYKR